ncbi:MAG: PKD domain-containing protein [Lewinellaceae bacterium]|nr:PKD domain-containing protein [Lewinellaceae bacterium]
MIYRYALRLFLAMAIIFPIVAKAQVYTGQSVDFSTPTLVQRLKSWEVYRLDADAINTYVQANINYAELTLELGTKRWQMGLHPNLSLTQNYKLQVLGPDGLQVSYPNVIKAFRGNEVNTGAPVSMTLDHDFIYGFLAGTGEQFYIEPLWYYDASVSHDLYVVYKKSDVIYDANVTCATVEADDYLDELLGSGDIKDNLTESQACYQLDLAIASDLLMFNKYGSVSGVENHNIGVINNVQTNYTSADFNHDLNIIIVTQFVVTGTDPWTSSTDAGTLLASFRNWGNAGNFGVTFDIGELWTNRNFDGSTIGIAYLNGVCNTNKYHCLQDFSTNAELLRCMTTHEMGHNWSSSHDTGPGDCPPNYIMCPFVSTSNTWSNQSTNAINNYMQSKINNGCLSPCGPPPVPLVADFDIAPNPGCPGQPVSFTDLSTGTINTYAWTFQGGSPPNSSQQNPTVTWNAGGTFNVSLTITGPSGSANLTKQITIIPNPVANFSSAINNLTVTFTNLSTNSNSWSWDFGDGGFSNEQNPVYTYAVAGTYVVTLTATNDCGNSVKTFIINTAPQAAFTVSPNSGCAALTVQYTNESSPNSNTFLWNFPGGIPANSTQANPVVVYTTSGTYNATLTAYNGSGSNSFTLTNAVTVSNIPSSTFTWTINGLTVTFNNTSTGATSYLWDFGDGNTSTATNPVHTYAVGGTYDVTLTSTNICGNTVTTKIIGLTPPPTAAFSASPTVGCAPLTVSYTNATTGNASSYQWQFPGGTPATSTDQNPSVVYNTAGVYNVTLIATNAGGNDTLTLSNYINVGAAPATGFSTALNGTMATFTNTTTGGSSYSWDFGDGNSSTQTNPVHTYATAGMYTVVLTATNACGTTTSTQTITVVLAPTALFAATPTSGCAPLTVSFTNQSTNNPTSFSWSFPGGNPATSVEENPTVVYSLPGTYTVTFTATNTAGSGTVTQTNYINVGTVPSSGFSSAINGAVVDFSNSSTGANSYTWDFGDTGSSTATNPSHTYTADGTYTVVMTAINNCGSTTSTQTVTIITPPTAAFSASATVGCAPFTVTFTNNSSSNATGFEWAFEGGTPATSTDVNPVVVYSQAGTYAVTLTATNTAGSNTSTQTGFITVATAPSSDFSSDVNGAIVDFTNSSVGASSYSWNFGDGNSSTETDPAHIYTADGTYDVMLIATNDCGNDTTVQTITIVTPPTASFGAATTSGCAPLTVQFNNNSSSNATSFEWIFDGGNPASSTNANPTVVYDTPGTYTVVLTASNAAGSNTSTQTNYITVGTVPAAAFTAAVNGAVVDFTNNSSGANSYSWDFGDANTSTAANPSHTYAADGIYTVVLTATNACGATTSTETVTIVTPPTAAFTADATSGCLPLTVQLTNGSSSNATSFEWTFEGGDPVSSTDASPSAIWNTAGVCMVKLTATNAA